MLKQALAVAVVGLLAAGPASAHERNSGYYAPPPHYHYPHRYYPYAYYPYRYAPIRYAPRYCPQRPWGWNGGYNGQYPGQYDRDHWHGGGDRYEGHDRDDHHNDDWDRHH